jgi:hypothetical protein
MKMVMEAVRASETSAYLNETTRRYITEDGTNKAESSHNYCGGLLSLSVTALCALTAPRHVLLAASKL